MNIEYDYSLIGGAIALAYHFEIEFQGPGWYKKGDCYILIMPHEKEYIAYLWDDFNIQELFVHLLSLPTYFED